MTSILILDTTLTVSPTPAPISYVPDSNPTTSIYVSDLSDPETSRPSSLPTATSRGAPFAQQTTFKTSNIGVLLSVIFCILIAVILLVILLVCLRRKRLRREAAMNRTSDSWVGYPPYRPELTGSGKPRPPEKEPLVGGMYVSQIERPGLVHQTQTQTWM